MLLPTHKLLVSNCLDAHQRAGYKRLLSKRMIKNVGGDWSEGHGFESHPRLSPFSPCKLQLILTNIIVGHKRLITFMSEILFTLQDSEFAQIA